MAKESGGKKWFKQLAPSTRPSEASIGAAVITSAYAALCPAFQAKGGVCQQVPVEWLHVCCCHYRWAPHSCSCLQIYCWKYDSGVCFPSGRLKLVSDLCWAVDPGPGLGRNNAAINVMLVSPSDICSCLVTYPGTTVYSRVMPILGNSVFMLWVSVPTDNNSVFKKTGFSISELVDGELA